MAFKSTQTKIGFSDPGVVRSVQNTLGQQGLIANGRPGIQDGTTAVLPNSTVSATATSVEVLTSANNQAGDTVTVYSGANNIFVSAIDQTVKSFIMNGVTQIIPGTNITINPSDGTGVVTISASSSVSPTKLQNGGSYANIEQTSSDLVISANGKLWTFGTDGNITLPTGFDISINYPNGVPFGSTTAKGFSNGTSFGYIPVANGNINFGVNEVANILVITETGANIEGTANITGLANIGGDLTVTGKSDLNDVANVIIVGGSDGQYLQTDGTGNLSWSDIATNGFSNGTSNGSIPVADGPINFNVNGNANVVVITDIGVDVIGEAIIDGNLTVKGTATVENDLTVQGNTEIDGDLIVYSLSYLNDVSSVTITGGDFGQYLQTDGTGNLSWATVPSDIFSNGTSSGSIPVADGPIIFTVNDNPNILVINETGVDVIGTAYVDGNLTVEGTTDLGADLSVIGTANIGGNLTVANDLTVAGESNLNDVGNVIIAGGSDGQYLQTDGTGNLSWTTVILDGFSNGSSNGSIPVADGPINFSVNGNPDILVVTDTGVDVTGIANVSGDLEVTGTANVGDNLNVANTANIGDNLNVANTANIGANLTVGEDLIVYGLSYLNDVSSVTITGGDPDQYLQTDGTGNLSWTTVVVAGFSNGTSNGSIPVADGNINFSVNGNTNILVINDTGANITGTANIDGNLVVTGESNLNEVSNVIITGGVNGQFLETDGTGNLAWTTVVVNGFSNGTSNGSIPVANGPINFSVNGNSDILVINDTGANIIGTANIDGNLVVTGESDLNDVSNVIITGGSNLQYLQTDGTGNLRWTEAIAIAVANGTSGLTIPTANGNVLMASGGNTIVVISPDGADVTGNLSADNANLGNTATANYFIGNGSLLTGITSISNGNSNVRIASNGNIALSVSGNANIFTFTGNSAIFDKAVVLSSNLTVAGNTLFNSNVSMNSFHITNLADPNVGSDAATKSYVDTFASGLSIKQSANAATTANLNTITGGTAAYNNGTSGVGANLTISGGTLTDIDGVTLTANMRLLIKDEANQIWNGVYIYNNNTVITRSTDFDIDAEIKSGSFLFVTSGNTLADTAWVQTTDNVVVGTSNVVFSQFSGAGSYSATNGINLVGSSFEANTDGITTGIVGGNIAVIANAQFTTPNIGDATGSSLTISGNGLLSAVTGTFSGNITANNLQVLAKSDLGSISNITITGGTAGQVLTTDGTGNLSFDNAGATTGYTTKFITANSILVAPTTLDAFSSDDYRSGIYQIQISSGTDYEATMISLLHDDSNVYISQYSDVTSNIPLANIDASLAGNVVTVTFTPVNAITTVSGIATLLEV
jgi:hypothetical protein